MLCWMLHCRIDNRIEMELKTLDLLGKKIKENNSIEDELRTKDYGIPSSIRACLIKQREDFMKVRCHVIFLLALTFNQSYA